MITFYNDHLVAPEFCKLIYDTVPDEYHVPVVFKAHTKEYWKGGIAHVGDEGLSYIQINLQGIFYRGYPGEAKLWRKLLKITYHEFGHIVTSPNVDHIIQAYVNRGRESGNLSRV